MKLKRLHEGLWPRDMDDRWVGWLAAHAALLALMDAYMHLRSPSRGERGRRVYRHALDVLDAQGTYRRAPTDADELERFEGVLS